MKTAKIAEEVRRLVAELTSAAPLRSVPLGELYHELLARLGPVTLGQFHDALRDLAAASAVRLSPWTGAMYQLQEPECCLILGREIMAYVAVAPR
jgi:hypothetical protein